MKIRGIITALVLLISIVSLLACAYGVFSSEGQGSYEYISLRGEKVQIYGKGLYQNDSTTIAAQGIAQDIVTMAMGVPVLLISLLFYRRGSLRGKLLLTGTLGYFLYTYASYCFVWMYNSFFLAYVFLMSASFFAFTMLMMSYDIAKLNVSFNEKLPVKRLGIFLIFFGVMIGMLWLGKIVPPMLSGTLPAGLEHYPTLIIQALDLGFIVPLAIASGVMVIKRNPFGYLIASVIYMKGITMATAVTAMLIGQIMAGIKVGMVESLVFPVINLGIIYCMFLILKNVKEIKVPKNAIGIIQ